MNELNKINGTQEIFNLLVDRDKNLNIDYKTEFFNFSKIAGACAMNLTIIKKITFYRLEEEKQRKKRITYNALVQKISQESDAWIDKSFQNERVKNIISDILDGKIKLPENLEDELEAYIYCALSIAWAFHSLACEVEKEIPGNAVFILLTFFDCLMTETINLMHSVEKRELIGDRNSRNQKRSDQKTQRLEALKLHPKYSELLEAIKKYRYSGKGKDKSALNKLLTEMTEIKNPVTVRHYRNCLIEEYLNSKK